MKRLKFNNITFLHMIKNYTQVKNKFHTFYLLFSKQAFLTEVYDDQIFRYSFVLEFWTNFTSTLQTYITQCRSRHQNISVIVARLHRAWGCACIIFPSAPLHTFNWQASVNKTHTHAERRAKSLTKPAGRVHFRSRSAAGILHTSITHRTVCVSIGAGCESII